MIRHLLTVGIVLTGTSVAQAPLELKTDEEKLSYALGMVLGTELRKQAQEINAGLYLQGLKDALSGGKTSLSPIEARSEVMKMQSAWKRNRMAAKGDTREIAISYKLDPRLTTGLYMGERWVSPEKFMSSTQEGTTCFVEAKARLVSPEPGSSVLLKWRATDPNVLVVSPAEGSQVRLNMRQPGETKLVVSSGNVSKTLLVKAEHKNNTTVCSLTSVKPLEAERTEKTAAPVNLNSQ